MVPGTFIYYYANSKTAKLCYNNKQKDQGKSCPIISIIITKILLVNQTLKNKNGKT